MNGRLVSSGMKRIPLNMSTLPNSLQRNRLGTAPAKPISDDQSRQREGGEHRREDAEAESDGKSAYRARAEAEQHGNGDERREIGIDDSGQSGAKAGLERADRGRGGGALLGGAVIGRNVGSGRHAER